MRPSNTQALLARQATPVTKDRLLQELLAYLTILEQRADQLLHPCRHLFEDTRHHVTDRLVGLTLSMSGCGVFCIFGTLISLVAACFEVEGDHERIDLDCKDPTAYPDACRTDKDDLNYDRRVRNFSASALLYVFITTAGLYLVAYGLNQLKNTHWTSYVANMGKRIRTPLNAFAQAFHIPSMLNVLPDRLSDRELLQFRDDVSRLINLIRIEITSALRTESTWDLLIDGRYQVRVGTTSAAALPRELPAPPVDMEANERASTAPAADTASFLIPNAEASEGTDTAANYSLEQTKSAYLKIAGAAPPTDRGGYGCGLVRRGYFSLIREAQGAADAVYVASGAVAVPVSAS